MNETPIKRRISRPVGLYIITVLDFIAVGLVPLLTIVWTARNPEIDLPFYAVLVSVGLAVMVMAAAVWAWIGDNLGRYFLLGLVTLSSVLLILNNLIILSSGDNSSSIRSIGWVIRASFWIGINWWYFNRQHVVAYFKQTAS